MMVLIKKVRLLSLCFIVSISLSAETLTYNELESSLQQYDVHAKAAELNALNGPAFIALTDSLLTSDEYPVVVKEHLLYEASLKLGELASSPENNSLAGKLVAYEPIVKVMQLDGSHQQEWLAYPIAANIRAVKHRWQLQKKLTSFRRDATFDVSQFIAYLQQDASDEQRQILNLALTSMSPDTVTELSSEIKFNQPNLQGQHILQIARQSADSELFKYGLKQLKQDAARLPPKLLKNLNQLWSNEELESILIAMLHFELHPSLALQQIARLEQLPVAMRPKLLGLLADRRLGGDAAVVIAKHLDTEFLLALDDILHSQNEMSKRRALLALKLSKNVHAKGLLGNYFNREPNPELRKEVMQ